MRKILVLTVIALFLAFGCSGLALAQEANYSTAVIDGIDADKVHLRSAPSTGSDSLGLFFTGTEVTLLNTFDEDWVQIEIGDQQGYMMRRYLRFGADPRLATNRQPRGVVGVADEEVPIWYTTDSTGEPDGWINDQVVMSILGETHDCWYYAEVVNLRFYIQSEKVWLTASDTPPSEAASARYRQVLTNQTGFVDAMSGKTLLLSQYDAGLTDVGYVIGCFAIADLDRDGAMEVAVELLVEGIPFSYLLLDERNGQVFGYDCPFRGLMELKQDGTASWSNGAGNNGFGWRGHWNGDPDAGSIALCDDTGDETIFIVDGQSTTLQDYDTAVWQQHIKPDAVWYHATEENLQRLFEQ